jgi:hypothetical protein
MQLALPLPSGSSELRWTWMLWRRRRRAAARRDHYRRLARLPPSGHPEQELEVRL